MRKLMLIVSVLIATFPLSGCWDRKEVSELALVMAKADDNLVRVSVQVAIPSKVGGSQSGSGKGEGGKSFFVVSATGRTVSEADAHIQQKLPRQLYLPHLRIILVGDSLARSGMDQILDHFGRNPPNRLRSTFLIAKDSDAMPLLQTIYPLESLSGEAIRKLERQLTGSNTTLMDFLIQASSEGTDQFSSAISLKPQPSAGGSPNSEQNTPDFAFTDRAIFRDLKLVGYVSGEETVALQWLNERLRRTTLTMNVPGTKGTISVDVTQPRRRAGTFVQGKNVVVRYDLDGAGMVTENTTGLDADNPHVMSMFQSAFNLYLEQTAQQCLTTVTKKMDADATGIGRMVYHQHPYDWERIKGDWRNELPNVRCVVHSQVKLIESGKSGPPLYGKQHRGIQESGVTSNSQLEGGAK
ncbi:Ger(x)C family spore germination protein [Alicyclobacillus dauci]|uniref:Ger(X)C family spore germination protein n=1 Tax=Alicyclobacillus dauci TaxID=1475485 RepID=A0ABY6Z5X0_9BACL|nr:Ger(x)C family spore germination protein [Alicyclobacillus dauci]WAH37908.1 Ger(x)C family spore germination protein [Alicyclobacillus dauci]